MPNLLTWVQRDLFPALLENASAATIVAVVAQALGACLLCCVVGAIAVVVLAILAALTVNCCCCCFTPDGAERVTESKWPRFFRKRRVLTAEEHQAALEENDWEIAFVPPLPPYRAFPVIYAPADAPVMKDDEQVVEMLAYPVPAHGGV
ncbi:uncharacterized protein F5Z01DRAFT_678115 [Emericellopsis atlantica]|uniref:Uncharacterized protein n=1 Tax=Emericellopsis atlantica TaxID=2614577 RepID=A0A9P8CLX5_9HYPO|nr:uncharacterized protein F5Z01DRAFT_678115 [Emericellopsis atlantica]KAG9250081.1 hypothetical protein F5Z01DRAFT_678115 [Emericellopsis atlantica]